MERLAARAQTVVLDTLLAAIAFALAFFVAPIQPELGFGQAGALSFFQLCAVYAAIAGAFSLLFRRELSPWRYVSIPDALVLARCALLTVGVFLLAVFVLDRAEGLPRSTLVMAPLFQMAICKKCVTMLELTSSVKWEIVLRRVLKPPKLHQGA